MKSSLEDIELFRLQLSSVHLDVMTIMLALYILTWFYKYDIFRSCIIDTHLSNFTLLQKGIVMKVVLLKLTTLVIIAGTLYACGPRVCSHSGYNCAMVPGAECICNPGGKKR